MPGLLEALLGEDSETIDKVRTNTGIDRKQAQQAYGAAVGTILRGLEAKTQTEEGAESVWDLIRREVEKGTVPPNAPSPDAPAGQPRSGVQVRDMDPQTVGDFMKVIFGKDAPKVEGAYGKVITLDPATSRKVFEKVLPAVLGGVFGAAKSHPDEDTQALPQVVGDARREIEQRQPSAAGIFEAILDRDGDGDVDLEDLAGIFMNKPR
ncbi:MAG: DUF937 domain-containing protein [Pirellulales bacterium]